MSLSRERLHRAVNSTDLGWDDRREKDVDILTAMGMTDSRSEVLALGGNLIVLKTSARSKSIFYIPGNDLYKATQTAAIKGLCDVTRRTLRQIRQDQRMYLSGMAVTEWLHDRCPECNGTGRMKNDKGQVVAECATCQGTGQRTYGHTERRATLRAGMRGCKTDQFGKLYHQHWSKAMDELHAMIVLAERYKQRAVAKMLENY